MPMVLRPRRHRRPPPPPEPKISCPLRPRRRRCRPRPPSPPPPKPEIGLAPVEAILGHRFKNPSLLQEVLTPAPLEARDSSFSFGRMAYLGREALKLAVTNYVYSVFPGCRPGQLTVLRDLNTGVEKLARVAVRHRLYCPLSRNTPALDEQVRRFEEAVSNEDNKAFLTSSIKPPKILDEIVNSLAGAIYIDGFDCQRLWVIIRGLLEPMVTPDDLLDIKQFCGNKRKHLKTEHLCEGSENICINGKKFVSGSSSDLKNTPIIKASGLAISEVCKSTPPNDGLSETDGSVEIECAKNKLRKLCLMKKWPKPSYSIEEEEGPALEKVYVASVKIQTGTDVLSIVGDKKCKGSDARNSAASSMIHALQESCYLGKSDAEVKLKKTKVEHDVTWLSNN